MIALLAVYEKLELVRLSLVVELKLGEVREDAGSIAVELVLMLLVADLDAELVVRLKTEVMLELVADVPVSRDRGLTVDRDRVVAQRREG